TRKAGIEFLMGGNASLRRSVYERGGGWDEFLPYHNEPSLFLRLARTMRPGEHLVYDPEVKMTIRRDVPGGVNQRPDQDRRKYVDTRTRYYLWVVARSYPARIYGTFPLFVAHFLVSVASGAQLFFAQQGMSRDRTRWAFRRALTYAPFSLARHLFQAP